MNIVGCDLHTRYQQIAMLDKETGELVERRLEHESGEARGFHASLEGPVLGGHRSHTRWFERLLEKLGHELWLGDAAEIRSRVVRKQKTDRRDAGHILQLLIDDRFPRIWVPSLEERDVRQLLVHRHKQVQTRTRVQNQLQAMALGQGVQKKRKLWTESGRAELEKLELLPYAAERRQHLLRTLDQLQREIAELNRQVEAEVKRRPAALRACVVSVINCVCGWCLVYETMACPARDASGCRVCTVTPLDWRRLTIDAR